MDLNSRSRPMRIIVLSHNIVSMIVLAWVGTYAVLFLGEMGLERAGMRPAGWGAGHWTALAIFAAVVSAVGLIGFIFRRNRS